MTTARRTFVIQSLTWGGAMLAGASALHAQAQALVADNDPQAVALGYKLDGTKTDKAKYPKYVAGQACGTCALFQGKAGATSGGCPLFTGKQVSAKGWCSAYAKKA